MKSLLFSFLILVQTTSVFADCYTLRPNDDTGISPTIALDAVCLSPSGLVSLYEQNELIDSFLPMVEHRPIKYVCPPTHTDPHCVQVGPSTRYLGGDYFQSYIDAVIETSIDPNINHGCQKIIFKRYRYCFFDNHPRPIP